MLTALLFACGATAPAVALAQEAEGTVKVQAYGIEAGAYQVKWSYAGPTDSVLVQIEFTRDSDRRTVLVDVATALPTAPFVNVDWIFTPLRNIDPEPGDCIHIRFLVTIILNATAGPTGSQGFDRPLCIPASDVVLPLAGDGSSQPDSSAHGPRAGRVVAASAALGAALLIAGLAITRSSSRLASRF